MIVLPNFHRAAECRACVLMQGMVFGTIGMGAGVIGTSMSNGLLKLRKKMDPSFESPNKPPDVVLNSATWALHMGVSSNLRYQILNGLDMVSQPVLGGQSKWV